MLLNPNIWFIYFKFIMITISLYYPKYPNDVTKKKYYDFIQNIPLYFPEYPLGNNLIKYLELHPLTPYLDSRESFIKWIHYINNKICLDLNMEQETLEETFKNYYDKYTPPKKKKDKKYTYIFFIFFIMILVFINFL